jgi:hypothetical protein
VLFEKVISSAIYSEPILNNRPLATTSSAPDMQADYMKASLHGLFKIPKTVNATKTVDYSTSE